MMAVTVGAVAVLRPENLVRWTTGRTTEVDVVDLEAGGRRVRVHFDSGEGQVFGLASGVFECVVIEAGDSLEVRGEEEIGVVTGSPCRFTDLPLERRRETY
jgi:hypothetical protein